MTSLTMMQDWYFYYMHHLAINFTFCQVQTKWSKGSYTEQITTFQLTAATSSKIIHIFFTIFKIFEYFDKENTYRHFLCVENVIHSVS